MPNDVANKELLFMKVALEEWRHWLEGAVHPFQVITDHKNLEYIKAAKRLNPRQAGHCSLPDSISLSLTALVARIAKQMHFHTGTILPIYKLTLNAYSTISHHCTHQLGYHGRNTESTKR